jgi:hypothetical protein
VNEPVHWREIRRGRTETLRVKKSPSGMAEWLTFAFGTTQTAPALGANFAGSTILVVVDPSVAFASVAGWGRAREREGVRSFLAGSDGHVLVHSLARYTGTELGASLSFRSAMAAIAQASTERRSMTSAAVVKKIEGEEQAQVTLASAKIPALPFYLIVEKTLEPPAPVVVAQAPMARAATIRWSPPFGAPGPANRHGLAITVLLGLLIGLAMFVIQLIQKRAAVSRARARVLQEELESRRAQESVYLEQVRAAEQARVREEMRLAEEARLAHEARRREELGRIRAAEQELVSQFEIEVLRQEDPKKIAYAVSQLAHRLCKAPALFFAYQPLTKRALLTTSVGLPANTARPSFMFELDGATLAAIQAADLRGEALSLSDYLPLSSVLQLNFRAGKFRSWALTGETRQEWSGRTQARFLGVLVVLSSHASDEAGLPLPVGPWIPGLLKITSRQYEKAISGS